ncbi:hypothetical protein [Duganella radicis]|uniref:Uncharacterized protein n=1 Tax=Duganella radicis TaxID=551988 RepID=A0A6L6PS64_9BURK|nr:hypothetical protein [Duganella radicis]MTV41075.1 hypothetical protein [Duganella radicis]
MKTFTNLFKPLMTLVHKTPAETTTAHTAHQPHQAGDVPGAATTRPDAETGATQGKSARKRFMSRFKKKEKRPAEQGPRLGLKDDKSYQAALAKLQRQTPTPASPPPQTPAAPPPPEAGHNTEIDYDHVEVETIYSETASERSEIGEEQEQIELQLVQSESAHSETASEPDETGPVVTGQPEATAAADGTNAAEASAPTRTPHEVAQGILQQVRNTMIDHITGDVLEDLVAGFVEDMLEHADEELLHAVSADEVGQAISARVESALEEIIAAQVREEVSQHVTDEVQGEIDAGAEQIAREILQHIIDNIDAEAPEPPVNLSEIEEVDEIEEVEEVVQAGAGEETTPVALTPAPVLDPKTHEIRPEQLKALAADFGNYIEQATPLLGQSTVDALKGKLEQLSAAGDKDVGAEGFSHGSHGLDARDCYKNLARECARQAEGASGDKRDMLLTLRALFDELKRHHLSGAATPIFKEYAAAELKQMKKDNIGMTDIRAGAAVGSVGEQKLGVKINIAQAELKRERKRDMKIDDDNDVMNTDYAGGSAGGGVGGIVKKVLTFKGALKVTKGGRYRKTTNFPNLAKIVAADEANHPSRLHAMLLAKSAGVKARQRDQLYQGGYKIANGRLLHNEATIPGYLTADKVAKGAYNTAAIHAAARLLEQAAPAPRDGGRTLSQILKTAYPAVADQAELPASAMDYAPLPTLSAGTTLRGKEKKTTITGVEVGAEAKAALPNFLGNHMKIFKPGKHGLPGKMTASKGLSSLVEGNAAVKGRRIETALERLKPVHTMITTGYTKDMRVSLNLLDTLESAAAKNDNATNQRINAKLSLYRDINQAFQLDSDAHLPSHDATLFGPEIDIPATYLGSVRAPKEQWGELLGAVSGACDHLQGAYTQFEAAAGTLHIENRGKDPEALKQEYATLRETASREVLGSVWKQGYPGLPAGDTGKGLATNSTRRREFIADTHDAISTALASAGTHLEIVKARILAEIKANPEALDTDPQLAGILDKVNQANAKYAGLSKAVEAGNIPVAKNELYRYNSLAWAKVNARTELEVQVGVKAGVQIKGSTLAEERHTKEVAGIMADLNTSAATAGLTLGFKLINQDHPNYSRKGEFMEFSVTGGAGNPLAGALVEKMMRQVVKALYGAEQFSDTEGPGKLTELSKQVFGSGVLDLTQEAQLTWRMHRYPEVSDSKFELQSFKTYQKRKEGYGGTLNIPIAPDGSSVELGFKAGQESLVPVFEYMGRDLGHHIINFSSIDAGLKAADAALKKEQAAIEAAAGEAADGAGPAAPKDKLAHLRELLDKDEGAYLKSQFFSSNAIVQVVSDYAAFKDEGDTAMNQSGFAFFHTRKVEEASRVSRQADAVAAGKDFKTTVPTPLTEVSIAVPERAALAAAEQRLQGMKEGERADYLLNTEEGRAIFNAYIAVVGNYKDINSTATTLHSYAPYIRQEEQSTAMQTVARPLKTAKNFAAALNPFSGGVAGGDRKAEQYLSGRGLFAEGKQQELADVMQARARSETPDAEITAQSGSWLEQHRIAVADNEMTGAKSLIVACLQQATGNYGRLYMKEAEKYLAQLGGDGADVQPSPEQLEAIVAAINKDYGKSGGVRLVTPGVEGHPVWTGDLAVGNGQAGVILRDRNERGEEVFSALVHKGELKFDEIQTRKSADKMMNRLAHRNEVRAHLTDPQNDVAGSDLRKGSDFVAGKGRAQKFEKLASATLADYRNPIRRELREMTDSALVSWIVQTSDIAGRERDVEEGRKELEKRKQMKAALGAVPAAPSFGEQLLSNAGQF